MSIAGITSLVLGPDAADSPTNNATAQAAPSAANSADTVQLTEAQQVYALYNQGQPASQIATALGLPVAVVNSYLNLSNSG
jgi:DNA-binding CsgD family transcriptional regulator